MSGAVSRCQPRRRPRVDCVYALGGAADLITTLAIANYRSIRQMVLPMARLNVVTGANGSGKSNLYRALRLLSDTARGGVIATLAREGGFSSTLWAGPEVISRAMKSGEAPVQGGAKRREPVNL